MPAIRLPDFLFPLINFMMKGLLRSPLHSIASRSLLLISFTGIKSGKQFTTPVRYMQQENRILMFSSPSARWWRNLVKGQDITLRVQGENQEGHGQVLGFDEKAEKMSLFTEYLTQFPSDSVYHGFKVKRNQALPTELMQATLPNVVIVEFKPTI